MMRKQYSATFKARVVQELLKEEKILAQIAAEYEVYPTQLKRWRAIVLEGLPGLFENEDSTTTLHRRWARQALTRYFQFYNHERLHQALDYLTPAQIYFAVPSSVSACERSRDGA